MQPFLEAVTGNMWEAMGTVLGEGNGIPKHN